MLRNLYSNIFFKLFPAARLRRSGAKIGRNVFFGENVYVELENAKFLQIADGVVLSAFTKIILHDSSLNNTLGYSVLYGKVKIDKNVYIGTDAIILPGTEIGENTIVGAGSLVKGILKKNSVYVGRPAKYSGSVRQLKNKWQKRKSKLIIFKESQRWYKKTN